MRKGQHLALESIATFGLTLIAAIGVVNMFNTVNNEVVEDTERTEAQVAGDRLKTAMIQMSHLSEDERGYRQLNLPEKIGGHDYTVALESDRVLVFTEQQNYPQPHNIVRPSTDVRGSTSGGDVRLYKSEQGFVLRGGR